MKDQSLDKPMIKLNASTLKSLPASIKRPTYDRSQLTAGIVHIGLGNFHRAHQSWYLHRLMEAGLAHDWGIIGAGVRAGDADMRARLLSQDCMTTLIEKDPAGGSAEIVGSMIDFLPVEDSNRTLIATMSDPAIRIVSMTVTEGGYFLDAAGKLDTSHPDVVFDAANPDTPRTAFGAIVAALRIRRTLGHTPFTGQCCDNLQNNGDVLRQTVVGLAALSDPELADWINETVSFPNSMVDCIVPATGDAEIALAHALGIDDCAPVTHENFRQWVVEDDFCNGRPPWEKAGVTLTSNVHAYESMKIRILNAGHQVLANAGELLGIPTISACMQDPLVSAFFRKVQEDEIVPYVDAVPDMTPLSYLSLIERRFSNPEILDTTRRVAFDGSSRHPGFVLPILRDALAARGSIDGLALTEALWARMCAGLREDGTEIEANDPFWPSLKETALAAKTDSAAWLRQHSYYDDLVDSTEFESAFGKWLTCLWSIGCRNTLKTYLAE